MPYPLSQQIISLLPVLRRRARRLAQSEEAAEDLVQEAALRLWQAFRREPAIKEPERYAMILLRNLAREHWRQRRITEELVEDMAQTEPEAPARLACAAVQAAIGQLPKDQHRLIQMVAAGETSPRRLAQITGLPPGTVMSRLARARKTLRRELGLGRDEPVSGLY
jgi:RNA polymerase sigma-70 factor (ECF subfamily)